jgi:predicted PhzF superfamily epimerase YddE/YHI9
MPVNIVQVDAFTRKPFGGNPAAVCILPAEPSEPWMQSVALEMNLSETAFLWREEDGFRLRWFTPAAEMELCGHATLASAHVLWQMGYLESAEAARFHTLSGLLMARRSGEWIELDFPANPAEAAPPPPRLEEGLACEPAYVGKSSIGYLVEVSSTEVIRGLDSASAALMDAAGEGLMVTARSSEDPYDFISRFFAPIVGIAEDPVTGAAHTTLAPYWSAKLGKRELLAYQASPRGGEVRIRVEGDRVHLGGQAMTVMHGLLLSDPWGQE